MDVELKIIIGIYVTGIVFILTGLACIVYGLVNRHKGKKSADHAPFGVFLFMLGVIMTWAELLPGNIFSRVSVIFVLTFAVFTAGISKLMDKKEDEDKKR